MSKPLVGSFFSAYEENLFETRYRNPDDDLETSWSDVFDRVTNVVADGVADLSDAFYDAMNEGLFIPSSPQLWNYGAARRYPRNGSSCFTLRMGDNLEGFREADAAAEAIYVASGGAGVLLNETRPRGCKIRHCSEGAMGSMCAGGPALRLEGTTGYITGSGRARGALMMQLSVWHPDAMEFILSKLPRSLGFLDDWRTNAWTVLKNEQAALARNQGVRFAIERFYSHWVDFKEWPELGAFIQDINDQGLNGEHALTIMEHNGVVAVKTLAVGGARVSRVVPMVMDFATGNTREANRDWQLPLQNCNMSIRVPDEMMHAVENDEPWVFSWFDEQPPKDDENGWTKTDALTPGVLTEYESGEYFGVEGMNEVTFAQDEPPSGGHMYRYGVVITTWEGLLHNLSPNKNMWRDTDYARHFRTVLEPALSKYSGTIMARQVWDIICEMSHSHADPGVVYETTYEEYQPVDSEVYGPRFSNPCAEYVNSAGGSCDLGSINLRMCVVLARIKAAAKHRVTRDDYLELRDTRDFKAFEEEITKAARIGLVYIAHALEYNEAPVPYVHELTLHHFRTVGIGIMGLAEAMMMFGVEYGSEASECFSAHVMALVNLACWEESFKLGADGWKKPKAWSKSRMANIFNKRQRHARKYALPNDVVDRYRALQRRTTRGEYATHTCTTSVAPTGTISQIAGWVMMSRAIRLNEERVDISVTNGIEPPFSWATGRQDSNGTRTIYHDLWAGELNGKPWMKTSAEVTPSGHVGVQAAVAAFTCMSVSKTVNLPEEATVKDISDAYVLAWKSGVPATSVFRDNSKPMQVLSALDCPSGGCAVDFGDTDTFDNAQVSLFDI
jgi:ribonucleotide reductase alpha subunit